MESHDTIYGRVEQDPADVERMVHAQLAARLSKGAFWVWTVSLAVLVGMQGALGGPPAFWETARSALIPAAFIVLAAYAHERAARIAKEVSTLIGAGTTYQLARDGFAIQGRDVQQRARWSSLRKFSETKTVFALHADAVVRYYMPKHAFQPADVARVRALLRENVRS